MATVSIPLSSRKYPGLFALIDEEDLPRCEPYTWCIKDNGGGILYAYAHIPGSGHRGKHVMLHRLIMNAPAGMQVDHINHQPFDCRRCNLRIVTHQQNRRNTQKPCNNTTGYKGLVRARTKGSWWARIGVAGKSIHLGTFHSPEEAARAYDVAARQWHGEFAHLNFPD